MSEKLALDAEIVRLGTKAKEVEELMRKRGGSIGNIVHESVPVSENEVRAILPLLSVRGREADFFFSLLRPSTNGSNRMTTRSRELSTPMD